jgi:ATP-binding cassette, subfamily C (CFTR/MRP), member 1
VAAASTDASVSLKRISAYMIAEEMGEPFLLNEDSKYAVEIRDGEFTWETTKASEGGDGKDGKKKGKGGKGGDKVKDKEPEDKKSKDRNRIGSLFKMKSSAPTKEKETLPVHSKDVSANTSLELASQEKVKEEDKPFALSSLNLSIPKGSFVAIVGRVGTGKSSLLQSMIGEMRKTAGKVTLGGTIAYVPQSAWIMNASLKQNVLFGQEEDTAR